MAPPIKFLVFGILSLACIHLSSGCRKGEEISTVQLFNGDTLSGGARILLLDLGEDSCGYALDHITIRHHVNDHVDSLKSLKFVYYEGGINSPDDRILSEALNSIPPIYVQFLPDELLLYDLVLFDDRLIGENDRFCIWDASSYLVPGRVYDLFWIED